MARDQAPGLPLKPGWRTEPCPLLLLPLPLQPHAGPPHEHLLRCDDIRCHTDGTALPSNSRQCRITRSRKKGTRRSARQTEGGTTRGTAAMTVQPPQAPHCDQPPPADFRRAPPNQGCSGRAPSLVARAVGIGPHSCFFLGGGCSGHGAPATPAPQKAVEKCLGITDQSCPMLRLSHRAMRSRT